ncbi:hypothetical protein B2G71_16595 [Novosphingobium sp. PC22D]|uniref:hypothetical protein n=1 Tax=Novosphingobium sp. PC22D TaxID=1962403 RepID=UPI000BEFF08E|nr:hypothetical protein [Novosphingobium sp. PC22D]PEQ11451.1 hypothetical protein B2G71_16595 [Novosphingobium sp. PC22D]
MRPLLLLTGATLALTSVLALAQDAPQSLLPPGFDAPEPSPTPAPAPAPAPRPAAQAQSPAPTPSSAPATQGAPRSVSVPVVQGEPASGGAAASADASGTAGLALEELPSLEELERMTPEEFAEILGAKPEFDIPPTARRATTRVGLISEEEGGLSANSLSGQNGRLVRLALAGNRGRLVSRWGHILLRRALASRLNAPRGLTPQQFLALRVELLLRMGEVDAARAIVQDIDTGDYSPALTAAAFDTYVEAGDMTGICPVMTTNTAARDDAKWDAARSICSAFRGSSSEALRQLDRSLSRGTMPRVDVLLAQKYAGAAGKTRRAVTIEWNDVDSITPWRYGLATAVGVEPPAALMKEASPRYRSLIALAPGASLQRRAAAADWAAGVGVLSSTAMVDLYGQIFSQPDMPAEWSARAESLRDAYVASAPAARLAAIEQLWDGPSSEQAVYSRRVLTAFAAARLPASADMAGSAAPLVTSMLTAGLDANALRWAGVVDPGSEAWALLTFAAPGRAGEVDGGALNTFADNDTSEESRKSAFLVAGLAGLGRIGEGTASRFDDRLGMRLGSATRWTRAIDGAAQSNDAASVVFLAGLGMQGSSWKRMTPRYLYHIVSALRRVGLEAEARMIAAEAVARA